MELPCFENFLGNVLRRSHRTTRKIFLLHPESKNKPLNDQGINKGRNWLQQQMQKCVRRLDCIAALSDEWGIFKKVSQIYLVAVLCKFKSIAVHELCKSLPGTPFRILHTCRLICNSDFSRNLNADQHDPAGGCFAKAVQNCATICFLFERNPIQFQTQLCN